MMARNDPTARNLRPMFIVRFDCDAFGRELARFDTAHEAIELRDTMKAQYQTQLADQSLQRIIARLPMTAPRTYDSRSFEPTSTRPKHRPTRLVSRGYATPDDGPIAREWQTLPARRASDPPRNLAGSAGHDPKG